MRRLIQRLVIDVIRLYQWTFSRLLPPTCRYHPSCSEYTAQAVQIHGVVKGLWLGSRRVLRCHPFATGGYDPVPPSRHSLQGGISAQSAEVKLKDI